MRVTVTAVVVEATAGMVDDGAGDVLVLGARMAAHADCFRGDDGPARALTLVVSVQGSAEPPHAQARSTPLRSARARTPTRTPAAAAARRQRRRVVYLQGARPRAPDHRAV